MNTSLNGINLTKQFEGCRLSAYPDPGTGGEPWTIGYGNTFYENGRKVMRGDAITQDQADQLLLHLLAKFEQIINHKVTVALNQNQFDALVCFVWNTGGSETLFSLINSNTPHDEIYRWWTTHYTSGGGAPLPGLVRRRKAEADLFMLAV